MKTIIKRISSKTPPFFQNIQKIGLFLMAIGTYFNNPVGLPDGFVIPQNLTNIGGYCVFIGGAIAALAQLTKQSE